MWRRVVKWITPVTPTHVLSTATAAMTGTATPVCATQVTHWPIPCARIGAGLLLHNLIRRKTAAAAGHFASPLKTSCCCFSAYLLILPLPASIVFLWFVVPQWNCRHGLRIICSRQRFNQTERQFLVKGLILCTSLSLLFCFFSFCFILFFFLSQPFLLLGFSLIPCILIKILWKFSLFWCMQPGHAVSTQCSHLSYVQRDNTKQSVKLALLIELRTKDTRAPQAC